MNSSMKANKWLSGGALKEGSLVTEQNAAALKAGLIKKEKGETGMGKRKRVVLEWYDSSAGFTFNAATYSISN